MDDNGPQLIAPTSWRDVYQLVRDTRADVLTAVAAVERQVAVIDNRLGAVEDARMIEANTRVVERKFFGYARSTVSLILSVPATIVGLAALVAVVAK